MCMRKFNQSEEFVDGIFGILNDDKHFINYAAPQKYFHLHTTKNSHLFTRKSQPTKKKSEFYSLVDDDGKSCDCQHLLKFTCVMRGGKSEKTCRKQAREL